MKMLSVLWPTVENEGRTVIRAGERFLSMRDDQEKNKVKSNPKTQVQKTNLGHPPCCFEL